MTNVTRNELEISIVWGKNNPELLMKTLHEWNEKYPIGEWMKSVDKSCEGFVTYIAERI